MCWSAVTFAACHPQDQAEVSALVREVPAEVAATGKMVRCARYAVSSAGRGSALKLIECAVRPLNC